MQNCPMLPIFLLPSAVPQFLLLGAGWQPIRMGQSVANTWVKSVSVSTDQSTDPLYWDEGLLDQITVISTCAAFKRFITGQRNSTFLQS